MITTARVVCFSALVTCFSCIGATFAIAQQTASPKRTASRADILRQIDSLLEHTYVLPDKAKLHSAAFHKLWIAGVYDSLTDDKAFADKVTADLRRITGDKHVQVRVLEATPLGEPPLSPLHHPIRFHRLAAKENKGFSRLEWLDGNIGLLELRRFNYFPDAKPMIVAAMTFLRNADAIIIDIRGNGGGSGDYLSSYFLPYPTQLSGSYSRKEDFLSELWTRKETGIEPMTEVPLFILISGRTFSAAEYFAYDMQALKRATLVGEPTGGGAHSIDLFPIGNAFEIMMSTERAVSPITGTNWEGVGVQPDVRVPAATALDTALVLAQEAAKTTAASKEARLKSAVQEMERRLQRAEQLYRNKQREAGRASLDSVFSTAKEAGVLSEFFVLVLAYNYLSTDDKAFQYALLQKNVDLFPKSSFAYGVFAYASYTNGDNEQAIRNYRKVLELDPDDTNAVAMIRRIEERR